MSDWQIDRREVDNYIERDEEIEDIYVPFLNCGHKAIDETCNHPNNATPECHQFCCPIRVAVEHHAHLTPETQATSQAVVNASALEQSDSDTPPAQAQVA